MLPSGQRYPPVRCSAALACPLYTQASLTRFAPIHYPHPPRILEFTFFPLLFIVKPLVMYHWAGMAAVCWTCAFPLVWGYHTTFLVNSASHIWGSRPYDTGGRMARPAAWHCGTAAASFALSLAAVLVSCSMAARDQPMQPPPKLTGVPAPTDSPPPSPGDLSTNCWWVALLAFGEGWHNAHHAFPYSARHGLEWWEFDATWILICVLKAMGIVWDVQVPSERTRALKRAKAEQVVTVTAVVKPAGGVRARKA